MNFDKKLIVTVAINYDKNKLCVFIKSILKNCPNCDVLFFCDNKVMEHTIKFYPEFLHRFHFKKINFLTYFRIKNQLFTKYISKFLILFLRINNFFSSKKNINKDKLEIFSLGRYTTLNSHFLLRRFIWYSNINIIKKYDFVYLTDCRDVFFQSDPLNTLIIKKKFIFSGEEPELIKNNVFNKNWIKKAYFKRKEIYQCLQNSSVICAGVTIGSTKFILDYLERMNKEIVDYIKWNKNNEITNLDQAFHNKIFSYDKLPGYNIDKENKLISTIGYFNKFDFDIDYKKQKISVNGVEPAIIHQYDRSDLLKKVIEKWYS